MAILDPSQSLFRLPPELLRTLQGAGAAGGGLIRNLMQLNDNPDSVVPNAGGAAPTSSVPKSPAPAQSVDPTESELPPSQAFQNALMVGGAAAGQAPAYNSFAGNVVSSLANGVAAGSRAFVGTKNAEQQAQIQQNVHNQFRASLDDPALLKLLGPGRLSAIKALARTNPAEAMKTLSALTGKDPQTLSPGQQRFEMGSDTPTASVDPLAVNQAPGDVLKNPTTGQQVGTANLNFKPDAPFDVRKELGKDTFDAWQLSPYASVDPKDWKPDMRADITMRVLMMNKSKTTQPEQMTLGHQAIIEGVNNLKSARGQIDEDASQLQNLENVTALLKKGVNVGPLGKARQAEVGARIATGLLDVNSEEGQRYTRTQQLEAGALQNIAPIIHAMKISRITERELDIFSKPAGADMSMVEGSLNHIYEIAKQEIAERKSKYSTFVDRTFTDDKTGKVDETARKLWAIPDSKAKSKTEDHPPKTVMVGGKASEAHWDDDANGYFVQVNGKWVPAPKDH